MSNQKKHKTVADSSASPRTHEQYSGLTKREHFAALAMQGLATHIVNPAVDESAIAKQAVKIADALIEELNK